MSEEEPHDAGAEEKSDGWQCCWKGDRIDAFAWAAILFWGALVLLAGSTGVAEKFGWWNGWSVFLAGAGVVVLASAGVRLLSSEHRQPVVWSLICGFVLLGFGLGETALSWVLPLVLIVVAVSVLRGALGRQG